MFASMPLPVADPSATPVAEPAVLIVEDVPVVAFGTAEIVRRRHPHYRTEIAGNAATALRRLEERQWNWILLEPAVPGAQGLSLVHALYARGLAHRCCLLGNTPVAGQLSEARHLGVAGYIDKRWPFDEFCDALDRVLRGQPVFPRAEEEVFQPTILLTCRQVGVLRLIQRGLSAKRIAAALGIAEGTVRNHTLNILRALAASNRTHAVTRALELGILGAPGPA
jgi:DNA-binding NarL/FixJ family response regulator